MTKPEDRRIPHREEADTDVSGKDMKYSDHTDEISSAVRDMLNEDVELLEKEQELKRSIIDIYNNSVYGWNGKDNRLSFPRDSTLEEVLLEIMYLLFSHLDTGSDFPFGPLVSTYDEFVLREKRINHQEYEFTMVDILNSVGHYLEYYRLFGITTVHRTSPVQKGRVDRNLDKYVDCAYHIRPLLKEYKDFISTSPSQS